MKTRLLFTLLINLLISTVVLSQNNNEQKTEIEDIGGYINFSGGLAFPKKEFSRGGTFLKEGGHADVGFYGEIFISGQIYDKLKPLSINACGLFSGSNYGTYYDSIVEMIPNIDTNYDWELDISGWKINSLQFGISPELQIFKFLSINGKILGGGSYIKSPGIEAKTMYNGTEYVYTTESEENYAFSYTIGACIIIKITKNIGIIFSWNYFGAAARFTSTGIPDQLQYTEIHKPTYLQKFKSEIYTIGISLF